MTSPIDTIRGLLSFAADPDVDARSEFRSQVVALSRAERSPSKARNVPNWIEWALGIIIQTQLWDLLVVKRM